MKTVADHYVEGIYQTGRNSIHIGSLSRNKEICDDLSGGFNQSKMLGSHFYSASVSGHCSMTATSSARGSTFRK